MKHQDGTNTDGFGPQGPEGGLTAAEAAYFDNATPEQIALDILRAHCGGNFNFRFPNYDRTPSENFLGNHHMVYPLEGGAELHLNLFEDDVFVKLASSEWMTFDYIVPDDWSWF